MIFFPSNSDLEGRDLSFNAKLSDLLTFEARPAKEEATLYETR